jgi:hypothetical protein
MMDYCFKVNIHYTVNDLGQSLKDLAFAIGYQKDKYK